MKLSRWCASPRSIALQAGAQHSQTDAYGQSRAGDVFRVRPVDRPTQVNSGCRAVSFGSFRGRKELPGPRDRTTSAYLRFLLFNFALLNVTLGSRDAAD